VPERSVSKAASVFEGLGGPAKAAESTRKGQLFSIMVLTPGAIITFVFSLYWRRIRMTILFTLIHVICCLFLIVVVLLQSGKAADLAGAFGGMGSQTAFGPRGSATLLSKATTLAAAIFMITSLTLAILATRGAASSGSVLERQKAAAKPAPAKTSVPARPQAPLTTSPVTIPQPSPANK